MLEINLENGERIPLNRKSLLILPADSSIDHIINQEDDYHIILIAGGKNRTVNIELNQPVIIVVAGGTSNVVNVTGGLALPISQAVLMGGIDNAVNGLTIQNSGRIISDSGNEFDLGAISIFENIEIFK